MVTVVKAVFKQVTIRSELRKLEILINFMNFMIFRHFGHRTEIIGVTPFSLTGLDPVSEMTSVFRLLDFRSAAVVIGRVS